MIVTKRFHFRLGQATVCKHTNLVRNVTPVSVSPTTRTLLQGRPKLHSHSVDPISHVGALINKICREAIIFQNCLDQLCPMTGWIGIHGPNRHLHLRQNLLCLIWILTYNAQCSYALTVQTKILRKGLHRREQMSIVDEFANGKGILRCIPRCKPLIGTIEKWNEFPLFHHLADLTPLLRCGIHTCRVVSTGMEKNDTPLRHGLEISDQVIEFQARNARIVIPILLDY
mmetsp:Transcript_17976/g.26392  ORF Transcript_17976/g.26392 Transcript_17976/m.26392 type:complete len:228 (+) Transcript_17976:275-958(+)